MVVGGNKFTSRISRSRQPMLLLTLKASTDVTGFRVKWVPLMTSSSRYRLRVGWCELRFSQMVKAVSDTQVST